MTIKAVLMAMVLGLSACAADDGEPVTVDGHWTVTVAIQCLADPVAIDLTVNGDAVEVADPIAGESIASVDWDAWKYAATVNTDGGTRWVIQLDPGDVSALVWYGTDGDCSVSAVPAISVERD